MCLQIGTHNRGLGYDNPRSRPTPRVRRVEFSHTQGVLKFEASGSDLAAFEVLAQNELGMTLRLHRAHQPDPHGGAPAASFMAWTQGLQLHNASVVPGASALFSTCIDPITGTERYLGAPAGPTIAELTEAAIEKGEIADHRSSGWDDVPRGGGGGWGARADAPVLVHNLFDFLPSGCIDIGPRHHQDGFREELRRVWARRQQLNGFWSVNSADCLQVPTPTDYTQIPSLNLALSRYGLRLSPFTHQLEISIRSSLDVAQRSRFGGLDGGFRAFVDFEPHSRGQPISAAIELVEKALNRPLVVGQTRMELFTQELEDYLVESQRLYNQSIWYEELIEVDRHFDSQPPDATLALFCHLAAEDFDPAAFQRVLERGRPDLPGRADSDDLFDESDTEDDFRLFDAKEHLVRILDTMRETAPNYDLVDWPTTLSRLRSPSTRPDFDTLSRRQGALYRQALIGRTPERPEDWGTFAAELGVPPAVLSRVGSHEPEDLELYRDFLRGLWTDHRSEHVLGVCGLAHLSGSELDSRWGRSTHTVLVSRSDLTPAAVHPLKPPAAAVQTSRVFDIGLTRSKLPFGLLLSTQAYGASQVGPDERLEAVPAGVAIGDILASDQRHQRVESVHDTFCDSEGHSQERRFQVVSALFAIVHKLDLEVDADGVVSRRTCGGVVHISCGVGELKAGRNEERTPEGPFVLGPLFNGFIATNRSSRPGRRGSQSGLGCCTSHSSVRYEQSIYRWSGLGNFELVNGTYQRSPTAVCSYQETDSTQVRREGQLSIDLTFLEGAELERFVATCQYLLDGPLSHVASPLLRPPALQRAMSYTEAGGLSLDDQGALDRLISADRVTSSREIGILTPCNHPRDVFYIESDPDLLGFSGVYTTLNLVPTPELSRGGRISSYGGPFSVSSDREGLRRLSCLSRALSNPP